MRTKTKYFSEMEEFRISEMTKISHPNRFSPSLKNFSDVSNCDFMAFDAHAPTVKLIDATKEFLLEFNEL